jgi:hypothetical protein
MSEKKGRNDFCPCGSGKKYKKCCGFKAQAEKQTRKSLFGALHFASDAAKTARNLADHAFKIMPKNDKVPIAGMIGKKEKTAEESAEKVLP